MPLFIDQLSGQLIAMFVVFLTFAYGLIKTFTTHSELSQYKQAIKAQYLPLLVIGTYMSVTGFYGLLFWPLPGSYNILFYDLYPLLGLGLIMIALGIKNDYKLEHLGFLGILYGLITIYYGAMGYSHHMTLEPAALLALYVLTGLSAIFFYPVSMFIDNDNPKLKVFLILDAILLILAGIVAGYIGFNAVPEHLSAFSKWAPII